MKRLFDYLFGLGNEVVYKYEPFVSSIKTTNIDRKIRLPIISGSKELKKIRM